MAIDAGGVTFIMPDPTAASATPAASNGQVLTGTGVLGGWFIPEDMTLNEFGVTAVAAGSATAFIGKVQLCRDTQIGNAADITGVPFVSSDGSTVTAASALLTAPSATLPVGTTLVKYYNTQLKKGDFILVNQTQATTGGKGFFYIKCYPSGETKLGTKLQASTTVSTLASTT